jgi:two-component system, response regulator PdtaR
MPALTAARILTVEDNPIVRADLRLILEDAGFDVVGAARDGVEAVELAREQAPDLVLIDLGLPTLDGIEATRQILHARTVPVVALTGHGRGDLVARAFEAGATTHILKPFTEEQLIGTLRTVLADSAERESEETHLRVLVERLVRAGHSEREIERAVRDATAR